MRPRPMPAASRLPLFDLEPDSQREWLAARLARPIPPDVQGLSDGFRLPGREGRPVPAAVLVPLVNRPQGLQLLLTQRSASAARSPRPDQLSRWPAGPGRRGPCRGCIARDDRGDRARRRRRCTCWGSLPRMRRQRFSRAARSSGGSTRRSSLRPIRWKSRMYSRCRSSSFSTLPIISGISGCSEPRVATTGPSPGCIATSGARRRRCCSCWSERCAIGHRKTSLTRTSPRTRHFHGLSPHGFHRVVYYEWGAPDNANVVVCVHGIGRNGRDFDVLGEALAPTHRVLAIDMPGRGASEWLRDPMDYVAPVYLGTLTALIAREWRRRHRVGRHVDGRPPRHDRGGPAGHSGCASGRQRCRPRRSNRQRSRASRSTSAPIPRSPRTASSKRTCAPYRRHSAR